MWVKTVFHLHVCIHPTLPVSQVKPISESPLSPARLIDDHPAFTVDCILDVRCRGSNTWSTGRGMIQKRGPGSLDPLSSVTSIDDTQRSAFDLLEGMFERRVLWEFQLSQSGWWFQLQKIPLMSRWAVGWRI